MEHEHGELLQLRSMRSLTEALVLILGEKEFAQMHLRPINAMRRKDKYSTRSLQLAENELT